MGKNLSRLFHEGLGKGLLKPACIEPQNFPVLFFLHHYALSMTFGTFG